MLVKFHRSSAARLVSHAGGVTVDFCGVSYSLPGFTRKHPPFSGVNLPRGIQALMRELGNSAG